MMNKVTVHEWLTARSVAYMLNSHLLISSARWLQNLTHSDILFKQLIFTRNKTCTKHCVGRWRFRSDCITTEHKEVSHKSMNVSIKEISQRPGQWITGRGPNRSPETHPLLPFWASHSCLEHLLLCNPESPLFSVPFPYPKSLTLTLCSALLPQTPVFLVPPTTCAILLWTLLLP